MWPAASLRARPHGHVVRDDGHFRFEIDALRLGPHDDGTAREPGMCIRGLPWHIRGSCQKLSGISAPRAFAYQLHVVDVGAAIQPLVGAGQSGRGRLPPKGKASGQVPSLRA